MPKGNNTEDAAKSPIALPYFATPTRESTARLITVTIATGNTPCATSMSNHKTIHMPMACQTSLIVFLDPMH
jgi:hypothetical protein